MDIMTDTAPGEAYTTSVFNSKPTQQDSEYTQDEGSGHQFLLIMGEPQVVDGEPRRALRSHVMRNHFRQKRTARVEDSRHSSEHTMTARQSLKGRFRLQSLSSQDTAPRTRNSEEATQSMHTATDLTTAAPDSRSVRKDFIATEGCARATSLSFMQGATTLTALRPSLTHRNDPFDTLPIPGSTRMDLLLNHWKTVFPINSIALQIQPGWWFRFALTDAAVMHSVLCNVAMHCNLYHGLEVGDDIKHHKGRAIKLINRTIRYAQGFLSDSILGAVAALASFENLWGSYDVASSHLVALKRLLAARGGFEALQHIDPLLRGILSAEYHLAASKRSLPNIHFIPPSCHANLPNELVVEAALATPNCIWKLKTYGAEMFNALYSLHQLSAVCEPRWRESVDRTLISNMLHEVDYQFLFLSHVSKREPLGATAGNSPAVTVVDALAAAGHAFLYAALRQFPLSLKIFDIFLRRIIDALSREDVQAVWREECSLEALLWVLQVGMVVARGRLEHSWFIAQTAGLLEELGLQSQAEFEAILESFAWTDQFRAPAYQVALRSVGTDAPDAITLLDLSSTLSYGSLANASEKEPSFALNVSRAVPSNEGPSVERLDSSQLFDLYLAELQRDDHVGEAAAQQDALWTGPPSIDPRLLGSTL